MNHILYSTIKARRKDSRLRLALALACAVVRAPATANPANPVVRQGSATFTTQGPQLTIHTGGNSIINWSSFNIGVGQTTTFIEPSATSVVWNHISDPNPTQILGHLDANGFVVLQNQSGFYIGGNAVINAAGLVMTTTPAVPLDVFGGGSWNFTAPPPTASIINYGEINAGPGGSIFLISHDIENQGTITAPGGSIGLCAGEQVLMSTRADGRGFSAAVTLPEGSVDNSGKLIADAGTIALNAQVVNQGGTIQANSVRNVNGIIEIVASDSVNLAAGSTISAKGDTHGASAGGQVTIKSGNTFSDTPTSVIDVSGGAQGGNGGQVEISASQMNSIQSQIDGQAAEGWVGGTMSIDPENITLTSTGSSGASGTITEGSAPATGTLLLNPTSFSSFSQILLQASQNIILDTPWILSPAVNPSTLTLQAGNNILFENNDGITAGQNWSVNLIAGANFNSSVLNSSSVTATTKPSTSTINMAGTAGVQTDNGNITLIAGNSITTATGTIQSTSGSILLQAVGQGITLGGTTWNLPDSVTPTAVTLQAAGNITINGGITAGQNWALNLISGATFASPTSVNALDPGSVILGNSILQTENGNINVTAAANVTIGTQTQNGNSISVTPGAGAIRTGVTPLLTDVSGAGGNINVNAVGGSVNTGDNTGGYSFRLGADYTVPGGISTAAGGNVTIVAAGNITSFLPTGTSSNPTDAGSGAFGPKPGVVTLVAGGSVFGHYVAADSVANGASAPSTIIAENGNAGSSSSSSDNLALSLATGSWVVNAPNGSINLQEVRNPQGTLDDVSYTPSQNNVFNYSPDASVTLNAGDAVNLLGESLPRYSGQLVPCIYPPSLTINAGTGGVTLGADLILFPSASGELTVNTTGTFQGNGYTLAMSDYGPTTAMLAAGISPNQWTSTTDFVNGHAPTPIQLNSDQPVVFDIGGDLDDVTLIMPKATQVTVGGNMNNVSFSGQNLQATGPMSTTFFHVGGEIYDQNTYAFETLTTPLPLPAPLYANGPRNYLQLLQNAVLPGSGPSSPNSGMLLPSLNFFYLPGTKQLGYYGVMSAATEALLLGQLQEITYYPDHKPILNADGNYVTTSVSFAGAPGSPLYQAIQALYAASLNSINPSSAPNGLVIGGPGQLDITAQSMNLGAATEGISSQGPANNSALTKINGKGAAINITLTGTPTTADPTAGDLDLFASQISSWYGGAISINVAGAINAGLASLPFQGFAPHGIWTSGDSDLSVIAQGDINVEGSRIATFDGGNTFVQSLQGSVNAGTGSLGEVFVNEVIVNPKTGAVTTEQQPIAGSGILATTLPDAPESRPVGNITVDTPNGNIDAGLGGITQEPRNGNTSLTPTVNLNAGGNIDAGDTGVIAINVDAKATGGITGLFISSGNSTIHSDTSIDVTVLAGGTASLSASGTISGLAIAGGGVNIGGGSFQGVALSQNVTGGGAQSGLASAATAAAGSQTSAAVEASSQKAETSDQATTTDTDGDLKRARARPLLAKYTGRVTIILPSRK
jgi:filamentous hemagglutinin family protein